MCYIKLENDIIIQNINNALSICLIYSLLKLIFIYYLILFIHHDIHLT